MRFRDARLESHSCAFVSIRGSPKTQPLWARVAACKITARTPTLRVLFRRQKHARKNQTRTLRRSARDALMGERMALAVPARGLRADDLDDVRPALSVAHGQAHRCRDAEREVAAARHMAAGDQHRRARAARHARGAGGAHVFLLCGIPDCRAAHRGRAAQAALRAAHRTADEILRRAPCRRTCESARE